MKSQNLDSGGGVNMIAVSLRRDYWTQHFRLSR